MVTLLAEVVVVVTVVELLVGPRGSWRGAVGVLTVVVVVVMVVTWHVIGVMGDRAVLLVLVLLVVVLLLLRMTVVVMVRSPVSLEASCLQLLLHMRGRRMAVRRGSDESLHRVFRRQAQRLRIDLLRIRAARHPVQLLQMVLLLRRAEARGGRHRAARGADRSGGHGALRLEAIALPYIGAVEPRHGLFLHLEFHQIKVIDIFQRQRTGGQLGPHGKIGAHRVPVLQQSVHQRRETRLLPFFPLFAHAIFWMGFRTRRAGALEHAKSLEMFKREKAKK